MIKFARRSLFAALTTAIAVSVLMFVPTSDVHGAGQSGCEGDVKIEGPTTYDAPAGRTIEFVCIKAGRGIFVFYAGETDKDGCYTIDWTYDKDGCPVSVTVGGGGTGRDCKSISHTAVTWGDDCDGGKK